MGIWSIPLFPKPFIQLCACQEFLWVRTVALTTFYTDQLSLHMLKRRGKRGVWFVFKFSSDEIFPITVNQKKKEKSFTCLLLFSSFFAINQELCTHAKRLFSLIHKEVGSVYSKSYMKKKAENVRNIKHLYPQRHALILLMCYFGPLEHVYRKSLVIKIMMFMCVFFGWMVETSECSP